MIKNLIAFAFLVLPLQNFCQQALKLSVENIMRDQKWIGTSPSSPYWSHDGKYLLFNWNPEKASSDSLYYISLPDISPRKTSYDLRQKLVRHNSIEYNNDRSAFIYIAGGDIYLSDAKTGKSKRITQTNDNEFNAQFSMQDKWIVFNSGTNLYGWEISTGSLIQLTNFQSGGAVASLPAAPINPPQRNPVPIVTGNSQEQILKDEAIATSEVLQSRKKKREEADSMRKLYPQEKKLRTINIGDRSIFGQGISPDGRFITYRLVRPATGGKTAIVPNYVTESGFTEDIQTRTKVGSPQGAQELFVFDRIADTVIVIKTDSIPGAKDIPDYLKDYPKQLEQRNKNLVARSVVFSGPFWSPSGTNAVLELRSQDNKDRWLMLLDPKTGNLKLLDRQRDEAWIAGPGISFVGRNGWIDENNFWFQSEATGYSHLYKVNVGTSVKQALTSGKFEVLQAQLSKDRQYFFIGTNEVHPGEQHYYRLSVNGGKPEKITTMTGANQFVVSLDEKQVAFLYSYSTKPWELYVQENKPGGRIQQITNLAQSEEFRSYPWKDPEVISYTAKDGANVYARLYKPANPDPKKPAVIFVHGAGYLQNAHKWWSSYSREYMFNNLLADKGYYVLDIDYRGSAGYGRDWRTGIYRYMGGKDLSDHIDGAEYLVKNFGVDPKRIGIYGGSYGGFITLMGLFTTPDVFAAGAALRPVTDWAHYNHGYTSNILNEPATDSIAYRRSSPIYFAEGLKGELLICHGMIDDNVHYQDAVRLGQRLIELGKDNWELAAYPLETHGFVEPSSWTDEYKRILKLFERVLKR